MQVVHEPVGEPAVQIPVMVVAELQDSLMVVMHDLHRLDGLLSHSMDNLLERFNTTIKELSHLSLPDAGALDGVRKILHSAVTELQFQDMASQLIGHTTKVLQGCAFRLAAETMGHEKDEVAAPFGEISSERPNPVTQSEMDAGSIELF